MSRRFLAQLAIGSVGVVGLLAATAATSFADPLTVYVATTTSQTKVTGKQPHITVSPWSTSRYPARFSLTSNTLDPNAESLTFAPAKHVGCGSCSDTASSDVTASFTLSLFRNFADAVTVSDTGVFTADYSNLTDSIDWTGANDTTNASYCSSYTDDHTTTTDCAVLAATLSNGDIVDVVLNDAADWDIVSNVSFELTSPTVPTVPEPSSIALMLAGVLGLGMAWRFGFGKRLTKDRV